MVHSKEEMKVWRKLFGWRVGEKVAFYYTEGGKRCYGKISHIGDLGLYFSSRTYVTIEVESKRQHPTHYLYAMEELEEDEREGV